MYVQNASVCTVRTSPCVPATGPHVEEDMRACCRCTRRRPDRTHGGVLNGHTGVFLFSLSCSLSFFPSSSLLFSSLLFSSLLFSSLLFSSLLFSSLLFSSLLFSSLLFSSLLFSSLLFSSLLFSSLLFSSLLFSSLLFSSLLFSPFFSRLKITVGCRLCCGVWCVVCCVGA